MILSSWLFPMWSRKDLSADNVPQKWHRSKRRFILPKRTETVWHIPLPWTLGIAGKARVWHVIGIHKYVVTEGLLYHEVQRKVVDSSAQKCLQHFLSLHSMLHCLLTHFHPLPWSPLHCLGEAENYVSQILFHVWFHVRVWEECSQDLEDRKEGELASDKRRRMSKRKIHNILSAAVRTACHQVR